MKEPTTAGKPFDIPKGLVVAAFERVKENGGAAGADGVSVAEFEADLRGNLYKIWNRMSSGSYFPPPVRAVEIPKPHGNGVRVLGIPTVADRVAQTVAAMVLEPVVERIFHPDSYGYRPRRSALDAVRVCRRRCWQDDWVIKLDIQKFFDSVRWHGMRPRRGWCCMRGGGLPPRSSTQTARCASETGGPRKDPRFRPCWPTCSCTTRWMPGWRGSTRASGSSDLQTTWWCTA